MILARWCSVLVAAIAVAMLARAGEPAEPSPSQSAQPAMSSQFRGSGSCSAVACHGSIAKQSGRDILKNEHTTWISDDRHSRAYQALFGARSEQIARSLAAGQRPLKPAYED